MVGVQVLTGRSSDRLGMETGGIETGGIEIENSRRSIVASDVGVGDGVSAAA